MARRQQKVRQERKREIARVTRFLESIDWFFDLNNFDKTILFEEHDGKDDEAASITYDHRYRTVTIRLFPSYFSEKVLVRRKILLHELCHSITIPMQQASVNFLRGKAITEEQVFSMGEEATSKIENMLHGLLIGRYRYARDAYRNFLKESGKKKTLKRPMKKG